jgi:hypothetical protein
LHEVPGLAKPKIAVAKKVAKAESKISLAKTL